jgi:hypothetical protein
MDEMKRFKEVIQSFKDQGYTDSEIEKIYDEIGKAAYDKFVEDTMEYLTEEDMDEIAKYDTDEEIAEEVKRLYQMRTGRSAEDRMKLHLTTAAEVYLANHERDVAKGGDKH